MTSLAIVSQLAPMNVLMTGNTGVLQKQERTSILSGQGILTPMALLTGFDIAMLPQERVTRSTVDKLLLFPADDMRVLSAMLGMTNGAGLVVEAM